jgi:hypothetical protein
LARNNIDRLEEALSGSGTSHRVNRIAVQPKVYGPQPPRKALPVVEKKKRTIDMDSNEDDLPHYIVA